MDQDIQDRIIEDYSYPSLTIFFKDEDKNISHFIESFPISMADIGANRYWTWQEPHYHVTQKNN